jgi:hypothetical protein
VFDVKLGGIESVKCHSRAAEQRSTHIELVLDPMTGSPSRAGVGCDRGSVWFSCLHQWTETHALRAPAGRRIRIGIRAVTNPLERWIPRKQ